MLDPQWLDIVEALTGVENRPQFSVWVESRLLPHYRPGSLLVGFGPVRDSFAMTPYYASGVLAQTVVRHARTERCANALPLWTDWLAGRSPVLRSLPPSTSPEDWQAEVAGQGYATVGVALNAEPRDDATTYLCMTDPRRGKSPLREDRFRREFSILMPLLHGVLANIAYQALHRTRMACVGKLTPREREILHWMNEGKTNSEISTILGIAFSTIKNHVQSILVKLQVSNRTQAISKCALGRGMPDRAAPRDSAWPAWTDPGPLGLN